MKSIARMLLTVVLGIGACLDRADAASRPNGWACSAPALPSPTGRVVRVSTEPELQSAIGSLTSGTTILIAPGTYTLTSTLWLNQGTNDVTIRGSTDSCDDVVLVGKGMSNSSYGNVPHGIWIGRAQRVTVADLTIKDVWYHSIQLDPGQGAQAPRIYNVHLIDAGEQFVKSSSDADGTGVNDGVVEYCTIEYTTTARSNYTNGVDVHQGASWIVRRNLFRNIRAPQGQFAGPAILMWNRSSGSIVDSNVLLNCQYGIALGLNPAVSDDHQGGIVRNNFVYRTSDQSGDVAITINNSANTKVLHNTVVLSGTYPNAIEYRFAATTGMEIRYNLTDGQVTKRDGASATVAGNVTNAQASWFVNAASGDLHLAKTATGAIDKASAHADVVTDFDGEGRTTGAAPDVGADEISAVGVDTVPPAAPKDLRIVK